MCRPPFSKPWSIAPRAVAVYRTLFYLPSITSGVGTAIIWIWLLAPRGVINTVLRNDYDGGQLEFQYGTATGTNLREGRLTGEVMRQDATQEKLMTLMTIAPQRAA